jgi:CBS domain containing-hemolysin-like protein
MSEDRSSGRDEPHQRSGWLHDLLRSIGLIPAEEGSEAGEAAREAPPHAKVMIRNLMRIGELRVGDIMVPRADILGVEAASSLDATVKAFREAGHSRLPVYRGTLDEVIGMLHVKDLLPHWGGNGDFAVSQVARPVLFVPPSMRVLDLLGEMQSSRLHMALVIDEYGGIDGLVTIEDLVEQIVGDIEDEYDEAAPPSLVDRPDGSIDTSGRATVEELEAKLGLPLRTGDDEDEVDTVGGLVVALAGRVPRRGEVIRHPLGVEFEVLDAKSRRVDRVRVRRSRAAA